MQGAHDQLPHHAVLVLDMLGECELAAYIATSIILTRLEPREELSEGK